MDWLVPIGIAMGSRVQPFYIKLLTTNPASEIDRIAAVGSIGSLPILPG